MTLGKAKPAAATKKQSPPTGRRRTYKEKLELESLPAKIAKLDAEIAKLHEEMAQPDFYQQPSQMIAEKSRPTEGFRSAAGRCLRSLGRTRTARRIVRTSCCSGDLHLGYVGAGAASTTR